MKHLFLPLLLGGLCATTAKAAVVQTPGLIRVEGILNGSSGTPGVIGDTLDYLKFEVMTTTDVTVAAFEFSSNERMMLAEYMGRDDEFGFLGSPYLIMGTIGPQSFTRSLAAGIYVIAMGTSKDTSYDIYDGFTAVNPEGGGFTMGSYAYSIAGDVRALEFWDGELDGTFQITRIPEPTALLMCGLAVAALGFGRRKS